MNISVWIQKKQQHMKHGDMNLNEENKHSRLTSSNNYKRQKTKIALKKKRDLDKNLTKNTQSGM